MAKKNKGWSDDPRELLLADSSFDIRELDTSAKPGLDLGKKKTRKLMARRGKILSELQERLYAEGRAGGRRAVLIVVQGMDTSGKGGVARHVMGMVDPQGVSITAFGVPTAEERKHHYLWRIEKALPAPGRIGVFDRSHYEDVLVARVDGLVEPDVWRGRYSEINAFERRLAMSGITMIKFGLVISRQEQGKRLMERLDRPDKRWKFSENDIPTRQKWEDYLDAYEQMFRRTSTKGAPWYVIPADSKSYARAAITEIIVRTMAEMNLEWPVPEWSHLDVRPNLASTMKLSTLRSSLRETEDVVTEAIDDYVAAGASEVNLVAGDLRKEEADETRELADAWRKDLKATIRQKKKIVKARAKRKAEKKQAVDKGDKGSDKEKDA